MPMKIYLLHGNTVYRERERERMNSEITQGVKPQNSTPTKSPQMGPSITQKCGVEIQILCSVSKVSCNLRW